MEDEKTDDRIQGGRLQYLERMRAETGANCRIIAEVFRSLVVYAYRVFALLSVHFGYDFRCLLRRW